jgi:hypothetical protein
MIRGRAAAVIFEGTGLRLDIVFEHCENTW